VSRWDKLVRDICGPPVPPQASTADVFALLKGAGWEFVRFSGNNYAIFKSPEGDLLNVPMVQGRRVKRAYLKRACQTLGLDDETPAR
jgi:hypothetical protein